MPVYYTQAAEKENTEIRNWDPGGPGPGGPGCGFGGSGGGTRGPESENRPPETDGGFSYPATWVYILCLEISLNFTIRRPNISPPKVRYPLMRILMPNSFFWTYLWATDRTRVVGLAQTAVQVCGGGGRGVGGCRAEECSLEKIRKSSNKTFKTIHEQRKKIGRQNLVEQNKKTHKKTQNTDKN